MALLLARPRYRFPSNPATFYHFSTSKPETPPDDGATGANDNNASQSSSSSSSSPRGTRTSLFSDVRSNLSHTQQMNNLRNRPQNPSSFSASNNRPSGVATSLEEVRKNLAGFQRRPTVDSGGTQSQPSLSFSELYKRKVIGKPGDSPTGSPVSGTGAGGNASFDSIRNSLRKLRENANRNAGTNVPSAFPMSGLKNRLEMSPINAAKSTTIGGMEALPLSVFGKEMAERKAEKGTSMENELLKTYSYEELGAKLGMLRQDGKKAEGWFSFQELNERLIKLREMEEKESQSAIGGVSFMDLRACIGRMKMSDEEKKQKTSSQRLDILSQLAGAPSFMLHPPKEDLVETYFHPENMSSGEKMKIELAKVREEFKMSESDCGSARVQVALLTTKIKHLSSVLHKKDKHSKKGLLGMVQKRKKLLKYLRRTDWDSFCLVLSKLGLRDNPDYKNF